MLAGCDVSSFQGAPGAWKSAAGDIAWAGVKFTELEPGGTRYVNPDCALDWAWLKTNSKGRIGYLFGHPSVSAADTVSFFISELDRVGVEDTDAVAIDIETNDGHVTPVAVSEWTRTVAADLHTKLDRKPLVYTFRDFAQAGNCDGLDGYPLWISDPSHAAGKPQVPGPWETWAIHQYATTGSIDRDTANYATAAAMFDALGKKKPPARKVKHWRVKGPVTFAGSAERHHTTPEQMVAAAKAEHHVYDHRVQEIIDGKLWHELLPIGTELFAFE